MEVGRPSDENNGGALLQAVRQADAIAKTIAGTRNMAPAGSFFKRIISTPFRFVIFAARVCHAELSARMRQTSQRNAERDNLLVHRRSSDTHIFRRLGHAAAGGE